MRGSGGRAVLLVFIALVGLPVESLEPHSGSQQPSSEAASTETAIGQSCDIIVTVQAGGYHDKVRSSESRPAPRVVENNHQIPDSRVLLLKDICFVIPGQCCFRLC